MELFTEEEFEKSKYRSLLPVSCDCCGKKTQKPKRELYMSRIRESKHSCSEECRKELALKNHGRKGFLVQCTNCSKLIRKTDSQLRGVKNAFCSNSCAASYNNTHKIKGIRRSKLEAWLEEQLPKLYPNLEFKFNSKEEINSELDIYIPSLKLAFELNGIFHYEPIYGQDKLDQIQNNDERKFQACAENGISLCIIDTSSQKYFKESSSKKFLKIISDIINKSGSRDGT